MNDLYSDKKVYGHSYIQHISNKLSSSIVEYKQKNIKALIIKK